MAHEFWLDPQHFILKKGDSLQLQIAEEGIAMITYNSNNSFIQNKTVHTEATTDQHGQISIPVTQNGKWMISTVKMERLENDAKAHWQSYWGSCT